MDMFAGVMNGLDELRRDMTKRIDQVDERFHKGQENLRDELTHVKSQARIDQAQFDSQHRSMPGGRAWHRQARSHTKERLG